VIEGAVVSASARDKITKLGGEVRGAPAAVAKGTKSAQGAQGAQGAKSAQGAQGAKSAQGALGGKDG